MEETKIIYHIDDEETPYLVKLSISPERVTLADFKNVLNRPNFKYFFKSMDDDFGYVFARKLARQRQFNEINFLYFFVDSVVKEEIVDDDAHLPCFNGRVVSWVRSERSTGPSALLSVAY